MRIHYVKVFRFSLYKLLQCSYNSICLKNHYTNHRSYTPPITLLSCPDHIRIQHIPLVQVFHQYPKIKRLNSVCKWIVILPASMTETSTSIYEDKSLSRIKKFMYLKTKIFRKLHGVHFTIRSCFRIEFRSEKLKIKVLKKLNFLGIASSYGWKI